MRSKICYKLCTPKYTINSINSFKLLIYNTFQNYTMYNIFLNFVQTKINFQIMQSIMFSNKERRYEATEKISQYR